MEVYVAASVDGLHIESNTIEFENGTQWLRCVQGAPVPHGVTGAEMTDRRIPRSRVARTVEGPPTRPKERTTQTTQTHPAHRTGSLQDTPTDGRQTHGLRLTMNCASELDTGMDHDAELEHVHGPEPACMIDHRHTPSPAQQGAPTGAAGGRVGYALALGQRTAGGKG